MIRSNLLMNYKKKGETCLPPWVNKSIEREIIGVGAPLMSRKSIYLFMNKFIMFK